jgi:MFS family permease
MRLSASRRLATVGALGTAQTIAWASTYYLPAVLASPIAKDLDVSPVWVFGAFSAAMVVSAVVGPWSGARIDRHGGRHILILSNLIFAAGLGLLALTQSPLTLFAAWIILGVGMGIGLYESAFSTLAGIYGIAARSPITGITLIAGFASTVGWPASALMEAQWGWRGTCLAWAAVHLIVALPLNLILPPATAIAASTTETAPVVNVPVPPLTTWLLAYVFAVVWFCSTAMAAHLPRLLEAAGATTAVAIAAGSLIGPAQVCARIAEFSLLGKLHPLISARIATLTHPLGAALLLVVGAPAAYAFTLLHGAGNGVLTIAKGTLPLALFGPIGYGVRQGLISAPGRVAQAFAPLVFGFVLERQGAAAIWLTSSLGISACLALLLIRASSPPKPDMIG